MNPPYSGSTHLKFLEKTIEIAEKVVSIQPIRWLMDPLAETKNTSAYKKFENSISKHIKDLNILNQDQTNLSFGIQFNAKIAIYVCDENGGYDYYSIRDTQHIELVNKVMRKSAKQPNIILYKNSKKDTFVPVCLLSGHIYINDTYGGDVTFARNRYKYFVHNKCMCERFIGQTPQQCKSYNLKTFDTVNVIEFDTEIEAKNFYEYITSPFFDYFVKKNAADGHINPTQLPFLEDYSKKMTNKELCEYFNVDGYISDTKGEDGSNWAKIVETNNYWKKYYSRELKTDE